MEFIQGEERCLKFINQDLIILQDSHIPSTFTNVSHTPTSLKEPVCITLPTRISKEQTSKENNPTAYTQTINPHWDLHWPKSAEHKMIQP